MPEHGMALGIVLRGGSSMNVIQHIASECREDRTYALTIACVGFWLALCIGVILHDSLGLLAWQ
jgi:hypothetical protein